jgi:hypothetical protein
MTQTLMTNTQLYLAIGLPILAIMTSLAINLFLISGIREDIREIRTDLKHSNSRITEAKETLAAEIGECRETLRKEMIAGFDAIQADLKEFYKLLADHDKRITRLEEKQ